MKPLATSHQNPFTPSATAIFLATAADRIEDNRESTVGLGNYTEFSQKTQEGVQEYAGLFESYSIPAVVAPIGKTFGQVRETLGEEAFVQLFSPTDNFHHTPHGTWLQCCLLYCMMIDEEPPTYDASWWESSRYLESRDKDPFPDIPFPTDQEAENLRLVAVAMCNEMEP